MLAGSVRRGGMLEGEIRGNTKQIKGVKLKCVLILSRTEILLMMELFNMEKITVYD